MSLQIEQLFSVRGKTAVVTGGSRGIGRMIAEAYVANGVKTYITARKEEACRQAAGEMSGDGDCIALPADLSSDAGRRDFVRQLQDRESSLDILVNNAGAAWGAPFEDYPEDGYDKVMNINVRAIFMLTRDLLPLLLKGASPDEPARVINIGSIDGLRVSGTDNYAYGASKAAVHFMTRNLALRIAPRGLTINAIAPGPFESRMMDDMLDKYGDRIKAENPLGRIGDPRDMAGLAIYLASGAAKYVNGQVIALDGGSHLGARTD